MRAITAVAAVFFSLTLLPHAAHAQRRTSTSRELQELKEEIRRLKEGQEAMRKDLQEIKRLLQSARLGPPPAPPPPEFVSVDDDPSQGSAGARVVLIDFSDYQ